MVCQLKLGKQFKKSYLMLSTVELVPKIFSAFFSRSFTLHQSLITPLKPIVQRGVEYGLNVPVGYYFQWRKATAGCLQRSTWKRYIVRLKSIALLQTAKWSFKKVIILKCKKMFLFQEIDKNIQFNPLFLENS